MIYNFRDEQRARGIETQKFDVRVFFAALVRQEQQRFLAIKESEKKE